MDTGQTWTRSRPSRLRTGWPRSPATGRSGCREEHSAKRRQGLLCGWTSGSSFLRAQDNVRSHPLCLLPDAITVGICTKVVQPVRKVSDHSGVLLTHSLEILGEDDHFGSTRLKDSTLNPTGTKVRVDRNENQPLCGGPGSNVFIRDVAVAVDACTVVWVILNMTDRPDRRDGVRHLIAQAGVEANPSVIIRLGRCTS